MDTKTQRILCCLGDSVAGRPTQFVMERLLAAQELDWRVLTVEVDRADFDAAIAGVRAMRFQGLRFFSSFQSRAAENLLPQDETAKFVGGITSALLTGNEWTGWHNLGHGLRDEITRHGDWSRVICWLHGDSVRTRSFFSAATGVALPKAILWSDPPTGVPDLPLSDDGGSCMRFTGSVAEVATRLAGRDDLDEALMAVVADDVDSESDFSRHFAKTDFSVQILFATDEKTAEVLAKVTVDPMVLPKVDQAAAAEAHDFLRWTKHQPDPVLLRDAYEEYCDF